MTGNELGVSGLPKKLWSKISINSKGGKQKAEKAYHSQQENSDYPPTAHGIAKNGSPEEPGYRSIFTDFSSNSQSFGQ